MLLRAAAETALPTLRLNAAHAAQAFVPPPSVTIPESTLSTCKVLGIAILVTAVAPCFLCCSETLRAVVIHLGSLLSIAALLFIFCGNVTSTGPRLEDWDTAREESVWTLWLEDKTHVWQLGGWCLFVFVVAILQLLQCCCFLCCCLVSRRSEEGTQATVEYGLKQLNK
jgi:hypothetical protein